jgi:hypothetical protein
LEGNDRARAVNRLAARKGRRHHVEVEGEWTDREAAQDSSGSTM